MFPTHVYVERRNCLKRDLQSGILLFLGNEESPINYPDNHYIFRQDSSFLYFWGIDLPGLAALIDIDANREVLVGRDLTLEEKVWTGPEPTLQEHGLKSGVKEVAPLDQLEAHLKKAVQKGRTIHFLPPYRSENRIKIHQWLGVDIT
jgi:Xaa-Pro aminopeptidase